MQIILVHNRLTQARTLTLTGRHLVAAVAGFVVFVTVFALAFDLLALQSGAILDVPVFRDLARATGRADADRNSLYMRENLNAMAVKLGEMQAQLMRLDALGERVSGLAGLSPQEFNFSEAPPMGGAEPVGATSILICI